MMTASPNRRYSGHHKATEEDGDQGILLFGNMVKNHVKFQGRWH